MPNQPIRAKSFDGVDGTISISPAASLSSATAFAVSFWAGATSYGTNKGALSIRQGTSATNLFFLYPYDDQGGNGARVYFNGSHLINQTTGAVPADGSMHHFLFVSRSSTDHELYVDGNSVGTSLTGKTLAPALDAIRIGSWNNNQYFGGKLFDVRIYDASNLPTSQEIIDLADSTKAWKTALDTIVHLKLDDTHATLSYDSSGNASNGTLVGGVTDYEGGEVPFSWQNEVGYSDSANGPVPRDESQPTFDVLGNLLEHVPAAADSIPPRLVSVTRDGVTVMLTYDRDLEMATSYTPSLWTFEDNGIAILVTTAAQEGIRTVELSLASAPFSTRMTLAIDTVNTAQGENVPRGLGGQPAHSETFAIASEPFTAATSVEALRVEKVQRLISVS